MLTGNGIFIWQAANCEGGDPARIAREADLAGFTWAAVKIADGPVPSNRDPQNYSHSLLPPLADALHRAGIQVWGWHYIYGYNEVGEAAVAAAQVEALALDGYIIDAEGEFKLPGRAAVAGRFVGQMRAAFPRLPMGLCSYRYPKLHPEFPWDAFLSGVDYNLPQVYWEDAHDPAAELARSVSEFDKRAIRRPVIPVGPLYRVGRWEPTAADLHEFRQAAARLGLAGAGYFSWDECRRDLPWLWDVIAERERKVFLPIVENEGWVGK